MTTCKVTVNCFQIMRSVSLIPKINHLSEFVFFLFRFNDFRVWPTVVESELQQHPAVLECMIYGIPNPPTMELVAACVVLKNGFEEVLIIHVITYITSKLLLTQYN
jgi:hypothetical protein